MRNTLIFKLMGAFLLVIAIGALVYSYLTARATQNAFSLYTTRSGQVWAQRLAPSLADYFAINNSWDGVAMVLDQDFAGTGSGGMGGQGHGMGLGGGMMMSMGQRLIVVDANGLVVADTLAQWTGKQVDAAQLQNGAAILLAGRQVGTLIVAPLNFTGSVTPAGQFLSSVNQAIISSVVIAAVIAIVLGAGLFFQITAPLRMLNKAASAIARGDLSQRVDIRSRDEFGELGSTFNHMVANLADAETQRQHLVADVAHELRTPLAAIQATLEGMQDGVLPLDDEQVAALYAETMLLNRLVGDLRLLSLAEAGQLKLEMQAVEPGDFLPQLIERNRAQAEQKHIHLVYQADADLPELRADRDRLTQVLNNLIANALRYTPDGGTIKLLAVQSGAGVEISVSDTGTGIQAEDLPHVFDRFYRSDKSRTRSSGGSGLGLAIVKQLVEAHGGQVEAQSPIFHDSSGDYGTRMRIVIPALVQ
jgi:signal transduction histidine kinase